MNKVIIAKALRTTFNKIQADLLTETYMSDEYLAEKYSHTKYCNAFKSFINSYRRFQDTKTGRKAGAGDTAVRECVWGFLIDVSKAINFDLDDLDRIWDENY